MEEEEKQKEDDDEEGGDCQVRAKGAWGREREEEKEDGHYVSDQMHEQPH